MRNVIRKHQERLADGRYLLLYTFERQHTMEAPGAALAAASAPTTQTAPAKEAAADHV